MEKETKTPKSWRTVEIEQQCQYGMTLGNVEEFVKWPCIVKYAYICHDEEMEIGKEPHIHCLVWFKGPTPTSAILNQLAKCGITCNEQQLERIKKDDSAVAYLTHSNKPEKHRYDDNKVVASFNWQESRDNEMKRISLRRDNARLLDIIDKIDNGDIREYNLHEHISAVEFHTYKQAIDNAFAYRSKKIMDQRMTNNDDVKVMWLYGPAGTGKTSYARYVADKMGYAYYVSESGSDPLGGYLGQPCLILDDVRPDNFEPSTLIKMLDPYTRSGVKSRYRNKWLEVRLIIVTCNLSPEDWWQVYQRQESVKTAGMWQQLTRRLNMGSYDFQNMAVRIYNPQGDVVGTLGLMIPQEVMDKVNKAPKTLEELADSLNTMLGGINVKVLDSRAEEDKQNLMDGFRQIALDDTEFPF